MFFCTIDGAGDDEKYRVIRDTPFTTPNYTGQEYTKDQVRLLAPVLPSKIVAIGLSKVRGALAAPPVYQAPHGGSGSGRCH